MMQTPAISAQAYSSNSASCWFPYRHHIAFLSSLLFVIPSYLNAIHKMCYFLSSMPLKIMSNKMELKTNLSGISLETCPCTLHCQLPWPSFFSNVRHTLWHPFPRPFKWSSSIAILTSRFLRPVPSPQILKVHILRIVWMCLTLHIWAATLKKMGVIACYGRCKCVFRIEKRV